MYADCSQYLPQLSSCFLKMFWLSWLDITGNNWEKNTKIQEKQRLYLKENNLSHKNLNLMIVTKLRVTCVCSNVMKVWRHLKCELRKCLIKSSVFINCKIIPE